MAQIIKAPAPFSLAGKQSVFLAGSIEMGRAEDWQSRFAGALLDLDVVLLNPRREDWDSSWKQSIDDDRFREQVEWELNALEQATLIAMYFAPDTMAPVTLLEFGLYARSGKLIVACPEGFWRKGNIEVVSRRYQVEFVESLEELITRTRSRLESR